jgi:hypothetical protein
MASMEKRGAHVPEQGRYHLANNPGRIVSVNTCKRSADAAELCARMPFGQFKLVTVRIADPRAESHTIGSLFEWTNESHAFLFKDSAKLPKIAGVNANVNICRCHLRLRSIARVSDQF